MKNRDHFALVTNAATRRQLILAAFTGTAVLPRAVRAAGDQGISRTAESIHQEPAFLARPQRIYQVLTDAREFGNMMKFSADMQAAMAAGGKPTEISDKVGGPFTLFGGHIVGRQVELIPGERIVQAWRVVDWKPGIYSIVKFELPAQGSGGTKIIFDHAGFPEGKAQHLAEGWKGHYWEPLRRYLA